MDDLFSHDRGQGDFCGFSGFDEGAYFAFMSGLKRAATRAGM